MVVFKLIRYDRIKPPFDTTRPPARMWDFITVVGVERPLLFHCPGILIKALLMEPEIVLKKGFF